MLMLRLALKDVRHRPFYVWCNAAILVGVLVPLLLLLGVRNGVYAALIGDMQNDPRYFQIDTTGNVTLTEDDLAPLRTWPEVAFLTPKTRAQFDFVNIRATGGRRIQQAILLPSGAGDPNVPDGFEPGDQGIAVSADLARQLDLSQGTAVQLVTQAEGRPRQLVLDAQVGAILPDRTLAGRAVLVPFDMVSLVEAFYDSYALPEYGIDAPKDLADRAPAYAGARLYVRDLGQLSQVKSRVEQALGIQASARTQEVESVLGLGRNLGLALGFTASVAAIGLGAALVLSFWSDVARKRRTLAMLAMMGMTPRQLALFPVVQAMVAGALGVLTSFLIYAVAGRFAHRLFGADLPEGAVLAVIPPMQALLVCLGVLALIVVAVAAAAWSAQKSDPAIILREAT